MNTGLTVHVSNVCATMAQTDVAWWYRHFPWGREAYADTLTPDEGANPSSPALA
jgi:hypothetical protein